MVVSHPPGTSPTNRRSHHRPPWWLRFDPRFQSPVPVPSGWKKVDPNTLRVCSGSRCVKGDYRKTNEDRCFSNTESGLFFVADGMGGHGGGAEASRILLETLPRELALLPSGILDAETVQKAVEMAVDTACLRMSAVAEDHFGFSKMGATLGMAILRGDTLYVCRVGDCRAYLVRDDEVIQLTQDQNFVQVLVEAGMLTAEEARQDPRRHLVLNSVSAEGLKERAKVDAVKLHPGDRVLLVTDGLTSVVDESRIGRVVHEHPLPQDAADELVLEALRSDSRDNIACVVIKALPDPRRIHFGS